jgi:putative Mg2+ transporter-C (MgtC) family protein
MSADFFTVVDIQFLIGIIFVFACGFLIGYERGTHGGPAGVRTHILVCFGSMLFTVLSIYVDPNSTSRIASNIITGVGFIGAGIIMQHRGSVIGLTTAATLWLSSAVGMAIGFGFYLIAVVATLLAFLILKLPHIGEHGLPTYGSYHSNPPAAPAKNKTSEQKSKRKK